jgi:hypothetical protein
VVTLEDDLYAALTRATQVMAQAEKKLKSLAAENAKLRRQVGIKERREEATDGLAEVERLIRKEMGEPAQNALELSKLYERRRMLQGKLDRLDRRRS